MRVAAIDIGTNSVLLLIGEQQGGTIVRVSDTATITRLGERVGKTGQLAPAAIERTLACLENYADTIRASSVDRIGVVGTSAVRDAGRDSDFLERAEAILGVAPAVITGEREAKLTFDGALTALETKGPVAVFDIGGGSTEIIVGSRAGSTGSVSHAVSLDIGAVRLTERYLLNDPPTSDEIGLLRDHVRKELSKAPALRGFPLVGVAGTLTTVAAVANKVEPYDGNLVHGSVLTREDVTEVLNRFTSCSVEERKEIPGLNPKRADIIIAGTLIADEVCARAEADRMVVSDRGVRWGLANELARRA